MKGNTHMESKDFNKKRNEILNYCERNNLTTLQCNDAHEVDFVFDFGMEAIDTETLENPTCIDVEQYIVVFLPRVIGTDKEYERTRNEYQNIAFGLMETAKPDYLMGAENGIVKAVMYCVWQ